MGIRCVGLYQAVAWAKHDLLMVCNGHQVCVAKKDLLVVYNGYNVYGLMLNSNYRKKDLLVVCKGYQV